MSDNASELDLARLIAVPVGRIQRVLTAIYLRNYRDWLATYSDIEDATGYPLKDVKWFVGELVKIGVVVRSYGMDDEGRLAGSGWWIPHKYHKLLDQLVDMVEKTDEGLPEA